MDAFLNELFDKMQPSNQAKSVAFGYFLQSEVLVSKWVPQGFDCVGDSVVQIVVPTKN